MKENEKKKLRPLFEIFMSIEFGTEYLSPDTQDIFYKSEENEEVDTTPKSIGTKKPGLTLVTYGE